MSKVGKLSVIRSSHVALGPIVEVTAPTECTSVMDLEIDMVTLRLTFDTAAKLAKALNKLVAEHEKVVEDSFCGAV